MSAHTEAENICYVTMNPQHTLVREHIRAGGRACALEAGVNGQMITLYDHGGHIPLLWTHLIPATLEGRAMHNVQNAMFAASMAFSLGVKLDAIRQGLRTFDTTFFQAPGRMNVYDEHPFKVLFDYGHNAHAVGMLADLATRLDVAGRRIVVLAGPGDRRDEDLRAIAQAVAGRFDHYICRRDDNLRDRGAGRGAAHHGGVARRRRRAAGEDLHHPRRAGGDRRGAAHGPPGRPAARLRGLARALLEADHLLPAGGRARAGARPRAGSRARGRRGVAARARGAALARGAHPRRARHPLRSGSLRLSAEDAAPFEESRRLTGHNRFFDGPGAVLESAIQDPATLEDWRARVALARRELRWPPGPACALAHATGASFALAAPVDQLITATEVNEWALAAAIAERDPARAGALVATLAAEQPEEAEPPVLESAGALLRLRRRAAREAQPRLRALIDAAAARGLPYLLDDDALTLGSGAGGHSWPLGELPDPAAVDWKALRAVPTALVTGTNGKTTVVRLIAACTKASGLATGYCCTDGVFVAGRALGTGDYSGPAGARRVLRDTHVEAAVLETARGGILRRGLAVARADVAVVTSIGADHFGEYGVHDLDALADVKLALARALGATGLLVANGDDELLARRAPATGKPVGWFAQDYDQPRARRAPRGGRRDRGRSRREAPALPRRPRARPRRDRGDAARRRRPLALQRGEPRDRRARGGRARRPACDDRRGVRVVRRESRGQRRPARCATSSAASTSSSTSRTTRRPSRASRTSPSTCAGRDASRCFSARRATAWTRTSTGWRPSRPPRDPTSSWSRNS